MSRLHALRTRATRGEKLALLTCYDASFARLCANAGADALLVGDSLGMVLHGAPDTLSVTMADMCYHTRIVAGAGTSLPIIADMPHGSDNTPLYALENANRLREAGADMVKLEGNKTDVIAHLVQHGIPICGHLGFTPQSVHALGGYKVQGRDEAQAQAIEQSALALQQAGAEMLVLEMIPATLGARITQNLNITTIGIGAGPDCDGQVLVLYDVLGIYAEKIPRFAHNFLLENPSIPAALTAYVQAVKSGHFPDLRHSF